MKAEQKLQIKELEEQRSKNYLVYPGYTDTKPEFGKFYSITKVNGFENLIIVNVDDKYKLNPKPGEDIIVGFDSYEDYIIALNFMSLVRKFNKENIEYEILIDEYYSKPNIELLWKRYRDSKKKMD